MNFSEVKEFFMSWGLFPKCAPGYSINELIYGKMMFEALPLHDGEFRTFVSNSITYNENAYTVSSATWEEMEKSWEAFKLMLDQD